MLTERGSRELAMPHSRSQMKLGRWWVPAQWVHRVALERIKVDGRLAFPCLIYVTSNKKKQSVIDAELDSANGRGVLQCPVQEDKGQGRRKQCSLRRLPGLKAMPPRCLPEQRAWLVIAWIVIYTPDFQTYETINALSCTRCKVGGQIFLWLARWVPRVKQKERKSLRESSQLPRGNRTWHVRAMTINKNSLIPVKEVCMEL